MSDVERCEKGKPKLFQNYYEQKLLCCLVTGNYGTDYVQVMQSVGRCNVTSPIRKSTSFLTKMSICS